MRVPSPHTFFLPQTHVAVLGEELGDQQLALRLCTLNDCTIVVRAFAGGHVHGLVALIPLRSGVSGEGISAGISGRPLWLGVCGSTEMRKRRVGACRRAGARRMFGQHVRAVRGLAPQVTGGAPSSHPSPRLPFAPFLP